MTNSTRKRYSINFSAPASPISPSLPLFQPPSTNRNPSPNTDYFVAPPATAIADATLTHPSGPIRSRSLRQSSFFRLSPEEQRNVSLDSLTDSSNLNLLLIGDAGVGKTAMILSYSNELPTRSQLWQKESILATTETNLKKKTATKPRIPQNKNLQKLKTIGKRKRYSLNDYEELFHQSPSTSHQMIKEEPDDQRDSQDPDEIVIDTKTTIGIDIKTSLINIDNRFFKVIMWDTAGQERYRNAMIPSLYKGSNGIILTYDICDRASFDSCLNHWLREAIQNCKDLGKTRFYLVGNKIDLYKNRKITHTDVLNFISSVESRYDVQISGNFEVSCKWLHVAERTFNMIIKDLVEHGCYEETDIPNDEQITEAVPTTDTEDKYVDVRRRGSTVLRQRRSRGSSNVDITKLTNSSNDDNNTSSSCCV